MLGRFLFGSGEKGAGLDASWWALGTVVCLAAGVGGLAQGIWGALVFFVPAIWMAAVLVGRLRGPEQ